jgi:RNA polymerase sigma-70 factor (ECF subfamily)
LANSISNTEKELFPRIAEGDEQAFKLLYLQYLPRLRPYLVNMIRSTAAADDVIQEAFIRIWLNRDKLTVVEHPASWIFKVAANECYKALRKISYDIKIVDNLEQEYFEEPDIQYRQTRRYVNEAIAQLTPQRKKIYEMSRLEGKKPAQIASELNLSVSTVKNTLTTTLELIRTYLADRGILLPLILIWYFF